VDLEALGYQVQFLWLNRADEGISTAIASWRPRCGMNVLITGGAGFIGSKLALRR